MSTTFSLATREFPELPGKPKVTLDITERSLLFDIAMDRFNVEDGPVEDDRNVEIERLTPEEVVDIAMKMLQATLYNVADPRAFMETVIKKRLAELFV